MEELSTGIKREYYKDRVVFPTPCSTRGPHPQAVMSGLGAYSHPLKRGPFDLGPTLTPGSGEHCSLDPSPSHT